MASFAGTDADGRPVELAVYGRDAADAQWLRKVWRFCIYRDSGPTLVLNRLQQVEHEAYLTFLAAHAGVRVPEIVAAGRCGPSPRRRPRHPAARGTPALRSWPATTSATTTSTSFLRSVLVLRAGRDRARRAEPGDGRLARRRARCCATSGVPRPRRRRRAPTATWPPRWPPLPSCVGHRARRGARPAGSSTRRRCEAVLTLLQRSTLDPETERMARSQKGFLKSLREALAAQPPASRCRSWSRRSGSAGPTC